MSCKAAGPVPAQILLVGEAPGQSEAMTGIPFMGSSGQELKRMLAQAGIDYKLCRATNVFSTQPPAGKVENFCGKKVEVGKDYALPAFAQGKYFRPDVVYPELIRLRAEIEECQPKLIIALGNVATWALLQRTGISKLRGSVFPSEICSGFFVLPTFHPAAILRNWSDRVISVMDFLKANRYVTDGFSPPRRELWLEPTFEEVVEFTSRYIFDDPPPLLSFDIETASKTITCIGFSPNENLSLTIPFFDPAKPDHNYWPDAATEKKVWLMIKRVMESDIRKLGQNGLYDIQYLYRHGIKVRNYAEDTMIKHHSLYPELSKGLGFLGSIYTDEAPWKLLRARNKEQFKLEDE